MKSNKPTYFVCTEIHTPFLSTMACDIFCQHASLSPSHNFQPKSSQAKFTPPYLQTRFSVLPTVVFIILFEISGFLFRVLNFVLILSIIFQKLLIITTLFSSLKLLEREHSSKNMQQAFTSWFISIELALFCNQHNLYSNLAVLGTPTLAVYKLNGQKRNPFVRSLLKN